MNEQLKTIVNEYRDHYYQFADRSDDYALEEREKMINYMTEAAKVAYLSENAPEYGYEITTETKKWINKIIWDKSGCEFWVLEHWAQDNKSQLNLITRGFEIYYLEAPYRFESYCFYMEKNRRYDKRFYVPRRKTLKVVTDDIQDLEDDKIDFYGLSQPSRTGKLISDDTPVLTKEGWKNHGDLKVGDYVVGRNGEFVKVLYVHPKNYANLRVYFTDHTYIDCHENHEWLVFDRALWKERIYETKEMISKARSGKDSRCRLQLPIDTVIQGETKDLPMNPYVFGVWLGDGTREKPCVTICNDDTCIVEEIKNFGYELGHVYSQVGCKVYEFKGMRKELQNMKMCVNHRKLKKYIPDVYFTASVQQRLELLAGLIDTDGTLRRKERRYSYSTISEELKDGVVSLISSFGWRCCVSRYEPKTSSSGIVGRHPVYCIAFNPTFEIPCRVARKQLKTFSRQRRICISKIETIEPKSGNCITVEGGLYRVGKRMKLTHNSTMGIFGLSWVGLRKPDSHSAMGGHSGQLAKRFFKGYSNLIETSEYTFKELFARLHPDLPVLESKSSDPAEFTINLGNKDEFATMSCRGIDGTWTGAIDVSSDGYLYVDDLIRDREHSMSASREENTYQEYQNKMLDRMNDGAKEIMIGTLWNVGDPLERERRQFEDNPRYRFRRIPALNDDDESNFQYEVKGFSTEYYKKMRDRLDKAEWMAKFQQQPFVREGLVFPIEELKTGFRGVLPDGMFTVVAVCDPAFGGGDRLSMPICATFKDREEKYIIDWVHDKRTPGYTVPRIVDKIAQHYITRLRIEKNSGGQLMADNIKKELDARGIHHCKIEMVSAKVRLSKEDKISGYSDYAKRYFNFMLPGKWTESVDKTSAYIPGEQYRLAMDELVTYSPEGMGKQHDDSADAIAQLAIMFEESISNKVEAVINPFRRKQIHGGR